jgi:secretion/DNA translocation related TadE-like protein
VIWPADDGERGSASLWLLSVVMVVWVAAAAAIGVGQATVSRHRVAAAADLSALAAASVLAGDQSGGPTSGRPAAACARAEELAKANGSLLVACTVTTTTVQVVASIPASGLAAMLRLGATVTATARAGFS